MRLLCELKFRTASAAPAFRLQHPRVSVWSRFPRLQVLGRPRKYADIRLGCCGRFCSYRRLRSSWMLDLEEFEVLSHQPRDSSALLLATQLRHLIADFEG